MFPVQIVFDKEYLIDKEYFRCTGINNTFDIHISEFSLERKLYDKHGIAIYINTQDSIIKADMRPQF